MAFTVGQVLTAALMNALPGTELDLVTLTADATAITATTEGTSATVFGGASIAYDATKKRIEWFTPGLTQIGGSTVLTWVVYRGATVIGQIQEEATLNTDGTQPCYRVVYDTPSAATFAYSVKGFQGGGGTSVTVKAGTGASGTLVNAFMRVTRA